MKVNIIINRPAIENQGQVNVDVIGKITVNGLSFPAVKFDGRFSVIDPITGMRVSRTALTIKTVTESAKKALTENWKLYLNKIKSQTNINPEWKS